MQNLVTTCVNDATTTSCSSVGGNFLNDSLVVFILIWLGILFVRMVVSSFTP